MHPRAFQLLRGVSMQPFFAEPDDQGGGAPADPPPADPPADPVDPPADPDPVDPPAGDPPAPPADPAPPEAPKRADWRQGRMDTLTARAKAAEEREAAAAERARVAEERASAYEALYGKPEGDPTPAPAAAPAAPTGERLYTQAEVDAMANTKAATDRLNEKLEAMFDDGAKAHGDDWANRVNQAGEAFKDDLRTRPDFWQALTKLPNATDVYHALAGDLNHLGEVLAMGPVDLGMELAKLSSTAAAKPKAAAVSKVPAPISPIDTVHEGEVDLSKADMQTYAATRAAQQQARWDAKHG